MSEAALAMAADNPAKAGAAGADFDVLIVGAGLSGIGAACHLLRKRPQTSFAILEARETIGGTWDLFRYPGIRSDSVMSTFSYAFRPWRSARAIADGPSILRYLAETAQEYGVDRRIRFGHKVVGASWRSEDARWTLDVRANNETLQLSCNFLLLCAGYYEYEEGYMPGWPGMERFAGRILHPQRWPEGLRYAGKRVAVIGSGATAVTLVPAMAGAAAHVVMLQRSPTYVVGLPSEEALAKQLGRWLPTPLAHSVVRWKNIALQLYFFRLSRSRPAAVRARILKLAQDAVGPGVDAARHFNPRYEPWDQRMCLAPDGDLFAALRAGKASVVTGEIETFTESGLRLTSGEEVEADIIVTATGLKVRLMGGIKIEVDGKPVEVGKTTIYKSAMLSDVPNLALVFGYTNGSWTLKSDLVDDYVCRLLDHMDRHGYAICTPRRGDAAITEEPTLPLTSGYIQRAKDLLPKQGKRKPWRMNQNYALDLMALRFSAIDDGELEFRRLGEPRRAA
jgi:cation diffusion facilitator CzcD-associated flavoprotein CzcO